MTIKSSMSDSLAIGIEIGGTKIQVGIGSASGKLIQPPIRKQVIREKGADGILHDIVSMVDDVLASTQHSLSDVHRIGIGFGGVLDTNRGVILKSYQIAGWDNFPLQKWAEEQWGKPVVIQNDARIVYAAAGQDDEIAKQILNETCQILGIAISNVIAILHPERVIVGGGVSLMGPLFWNTLRSEVTARAMPLFISSVQIFKADLGKMSW